MGHSRTRSALQALPESGEHRAGGGSSHTPKRVCAARAPRVAQRLGARTCAASMSASAATARWLHRRPRPLSPCRVAGGADGEAISIEVEKKSRDLGAEEILPPKNLESFSGFVKGG